MNLLLVQGLLSMYLAGNPADLSQGSVASIEENPTSVRYCLAEPDKHEPKHDDKHKDKHDDKHKDKEKHDDKAKDKHDDKHKDGHGDPHKGDHHG